MEGREAGWPLRLGRFLHEREGLLMISDGCLALRLEPADLLAGQGAGPGPSLHWAESSALGGPRFLFGFRAATGAPLQLRLEQVHASGPLFEGWHRPPALIEAPLFGLREPVAGQLCAFRFGSALA